MIDYKIVTYDYNLKKDVIDFLIKIAVKEFGHKNWTDYLNNKDFTPYDNVNSIFYIVFYDNKIIGTIGALKTNKDTIKINSFYIDKKYRNNKIGTKLYNLVYDFSKEKYKNIILCTYKEYEIAFNFYSKNNFYIYERDGEEIWMKKEI